MELVEREEEIIEIIKRFSELGIDFVLVGGYAVSSLTRHRFSVDCDLVVSEPLGEIRKLLEEEGYKPHLKKEGFDPVYGGRFENYVKKINSTEVAVDLLVNGLTSRGTDATWSFGYIKEHSVRVKLLGRENHLACRVPERELLLAMKIHSGRKTDVRDIVMLRKGCDAEKVVKHVKRGDLKVLKRKINQILENLEDPRLVDSLKGVFRIKEEVKGDIEETGKFIKSLEAGI